MSYLVYNLMELTVSVQIQTTSCWVLFEFFYMMDMMLDFGLWIRFVYLTRHLMPAFGT